MRKLATALTAAAMLLGGTALEAKPKLTPEQRLEKLLEGREAGKPVHCLPMWQTSEMEIIDHVAIVYGRGETIWVNRPKDPKYLDSDDILVTRTYGTELCDLDIVHTIDRSSHFTTGFISLGEFVPYKRVKPAE
jgi:hypothetical protein